MRKIVSLNSPAESPMFDWQSPKSWSWRAATCVLKLGSWAFSGREETEFLWIRDQPKQLVKCQNDGWKIKEKNTIVLQTAQQLTKICCIIRHTSLDPHNQLIEYLSLRRMRPRFARDFKLNKNNSKWYIKRWTAYLSIKHWSIFRFISLCHLLLVVQWSNWAVYINVSLCITGKKLGRKYAFLLRGISPFAIHFIWNILTHYSHNLQSFDILVTIRELIDDRSVCFLYVLVL